MEQALEGGESLHRVKGKPGPKPKIAAIEAPQDTSPAQVDESPAQAYALRVWGGQSVDVPRAERIERCMNALRGQNLSTENIIFPT
jgi:hypothetical protein